MILRESRFGGLFRLIPIFLIFLLVLALLNPGTVHGGSEEEMALTIVYFYNNPCGSCDDEEVFIEDFNRILGDQKQMVSIDLRIYNTFQAGSHNLLSQYLNTFMVPEVERDGEQFLFIGDSYITGRDAIMEELLDTFLMEAASIQTAADNPGSRDENPNEPGAERLPLDIPLSETDSVVVYFYVAPCSDCDAVSEYFETLDASILLTINGVQTSSELKILRYNVSIPEHLALAHALFAQYDVPENQQQVPAAYIGSTYLSGEQAIQEDLLALLQSGEGLQTTTFINQDAGPPAAVEGLTGYQGAGVFLTGLINGLNPCSLSMLLFFISILITRDVSILKLGFAFIIGKFIAYLALGLSFFNLFRVLNEGMLQGMQNILKWFLLLVALFLVLQNLRDYFAAKGERYDKVFLQLPVALRKRNHNWMKRLNGIEGEGLLLAVSFLLGVVISIGEFLCTGQIYLATILYVIHAQAALDPRAVFYFILYCIGIIIPLAVMVVAIHKGKEVFNVTEFLRARMHVIKLINAIVFIIFAFIIFFLF